MFLNKHVNIFIEEVWGWNKCVEPGRDWNKSLPVGQNREHEVLTCQQVEQQHQRATKSAVHLVHPRTVHEIPLQSLTF